jgi:hypothetical protein
MKSPIRIAAVLTLAAAFAARLPAQTLYTPGGTVGNIGGTNVGIGTSTPGEKLEVNGNVRVGTSLRLRQSTSSNFVVEHISDTGDLYIRSMEPGDTSGNLIINDNAGNVGIGTTTPEQRLTVKGGGIGFDGNASDKKLYSPVDGVLEWMTHDSAGEHAFAVSHQGTKRVYLSTAGNSYLLGGNVGIGTTNPGTNKLSVNGTIRAKEVIVEASPWPDDVFEPGYRLKALSEVAAHIEAEGHLPDVPNAASVAEQGVAVGEMQKTLLRKIEEMTLYMIELDKAQRDLRAQNESLVEENAFLRSELNSLKQTLNHQSHETHE